MGRIHNFLEEKPLIILNEDELEEGNLYFTTLDHHQIPLFKDIPTMTKVSGKNETEHMIIDDYSNSYDYNSNNRISLKEPFMVLRKEKRYAKYTCIQLLQGDMMLWIIQKYPNLTRKNYDGYFSALEWTETKEVNFLLREINKRRNKEITDSYSKNTEKEAVQNLKDFIKQKIAIEKQKQKNAPTFQALKDKYIKKS